MDGDNIILNYLDRYHAGEILEEDFKKRLESDSELQQAFDQYQQDLKVIRIGAKEQLKKKAELALKMHEQKKIKTFTLKRFLQVAASVSLLVAAIFLLKDNSSSSSTTDLYAAHFKLPEAAGERSVSSQSDAWNDAMIAYSNMDFKMSIELLVPLVGQEDFPFADRGNLYIGLSNLMLNENQKAIKHFEAINTESSFVQDAEWFRALALLKTGNLVKTKYALQKITNQPRHFKHQEAVEILNQLQ